MELRHLRYFIEVALEENVTRAAEKLHVSQPALSRQVKDLEEELGFSLLVRTAKSVSLTEAGRVFLDEASEVLERLEEGVVKARAAAEGGGGELHIGYAPSLTVRILPPTIRAFQAEFPNVKVKLHDLSSEEMLEGFRDGSLDFVLMPESKIRTASNCRFEALKTEDLRLAVGLEHPFAALEKVPIQKLKGEKLIGFNLKEYPEYGELFTKTLKPAGIRKKLAEEHESVSSLVAAVEAGMGVSVVTESIQCVAGGRVKIVPLDPPGEAVVVGIAWKERELTREETAFVAKALGACERSL
ncbi:LysR family transcriptional regulator [Pelagicoccus mobilis]|uniref:LysR family transcriptional regulator n=1 Tax=Pelagicoccus mobilis TaxID=415221 RepID=A0A934RYH6_9BACT|nr:LysR family transcriptional regulator [Pelagicoccus mobilis]MBK1876672.1 LysR family transcriptional regulator [Pelagicoccus mobilis]